MKEVYKFDNQREYKVYFRIPFTRYFICKEIIWGYFELCAKYWNEKKGGYSWSVK